MQEPQAQLQSARSYSTMTKKAKDAIRKIGKDQLSQIRLAFLDCDKNGDGRLSVKEFQSMMHKQKCYTEAEVNVLIHAMDVDGSGTIDFAEYLSLVAQEDAAPLDQPSDAQIDALFRMIDRNGDGNVTKSELKTGMATIGILIEDQDLTRMWRKSHGNTGSLDKVQFTKMIREYGF